jgi:hypothetical protein
LRHKAKIDWWIALAILGGIAAPLLGGNYWISGMILLAVLTCLYPQSYETTPEGLLIRTGLIRNRIPYAAITAVRSCPDSRSGFALSLDRILISHGAGNETVIAPADRESFLADMTIRAPQLAKPGFDLTSALL